MPAKGNIRCTLGLYGQQSALAKEIGYVFGPASRHAGKANTAWIYCLWRDGILPKKELARAKVLELANYGRSETPPLPFMPTETYDALPFKGEVVEVEKQVGDLIYLYYIAQVSRKGWLVYSPSTGNYPRRRFKSYEDAYNEIFE